jgi:16S rRNA (uracil1498-N3)-methyltransferase
MPRIYHPASLQTGLNFALTPQGTRHVQVLRLQPGDTLTLFGDPVRGGEWSAVVQGMGRQTVHVQAVAHHAIEREPSRAIHLVVGMPTNDRMDWLVEKATELGVASIQPLMTERSVLRLQGERADKKRAHWQAVAVSACEQCGGNRVPVLHEVLTLDAWLRQPIDGARAMLCLAAGSQPLRDWAGQQGPSQPVWLLHGPEGGLAPAEARRLLELGWQPVTLGPRVLRAETAAIVATTWMAGAA